MSSMDFKAEYDRYLKSAEAQVDKYFTVLQIPQKSVLEAMRYAITAGGKRVRSVLSMACAELFGGNLQDAARVALAVECIHNYSLIHDDMPCMDDDDLRRGRPTCHKAFGEGIAMLAGDGLLNAAFEILSDRDSFESLSDSSLISIISCLAAASGTAGMIGGQVMDLEQEKRSDVALDELVCMHAGKTGALIRAAAVCGCLSAGLDESDKRIKVIDRFAEKLGLAFQIKDDILDVFGDEEVLGKPIGSDERSGKTTFVTLLGSDGAEEYLKRTTAEAKAALAELDEDTWFLSELADFLLDRMY